MRGEVNMLLPPVISGIRRVSLSKVAPFTFKGLVELPDIPKVYTYEEALSWARANIPVDGVEIVSWMHECYAANQVLWAFEEEYRRSGSEVRSGCSDAYIPGLRVEDLSFARIPGSTVAAQGYAPGYARGTRIDVPGPFGKALMLLRDLFGFGVVGRCYSYQWNGALAQFTDLATTPIREPIRVPRFWNMNTYLPFIASPGPVPVSFLTLRISVSGPCRVRLLRHDVGDYTRYEVFDELSLDAGETEVTYSCMGVPTAPRFVVTLAPIDDGPTVQLRSASMAP